MNRHHQYHQHYKMDFSISADEIAARTDQLIAFHKELLDAIAALDEKKATFENTFLAMEQFDRCTEAIDNSCTFLRYVSTSKDVRDASVAAQEALDKYRVEAMMRKDVYTVLNSVEAPAEGTIERRLRDKMLEAFNLKGIALKGESAERYGQIQKRLSELETKFEQTISEDKTHVVVTRADLDGLPDDYFDALQVVPDDESSRRRTRERAYFRYVIGLDDGDAVRNYVEAERLERRYVVTMKYPDYVPAIKFAKNAATRRALYMAYNSRCQSNVGRLQEAMYLRDEAAALLGFENHAAYILKSRMAKTPERVATFLRDLQTKLAPKRNKEYAAMLALKQQEEGPIDDPLQPWDVAYYLRLYKEREFGVDQLRVKQCFPLDRVLQGTFDVYQHLLGLRFIEEQMVDARSKWHDDVTMYRVEDASTNAVLGQFYLDLHPRDDKYEHCACWGLVHAYERTDGSRNPAIAAMVCNFTSPTNEQPNPTLPHDEVITFFHEFGHAMHHICSQSKYRYFSGMQVENDFLEGPSQMLEYWCWSPTIIEQHLGTDMPVDLLESLIRAKTADAGTVYSRQMFVAMFDQAIHTNDAHSDTATVWNSIYDGVCGMPHAPGTFGAATFGHVMDGYDAQYYGYAWSEVFAADMFERFFETDPLNAAAGRRYRDIVLAPGGSRDAADVLRDFLGREPLQDSFLRMQIGYDCDEELEQEVSEFQVLSTPTTTDATAQ